MQTTRSPIRPRPSSESLIPTLLRTLRERLLPGRPRRWRGSPRPATSPALVQDLRLPPDEPRWMVLDRGDVLHLRQGQLLLSARSGWLEAPMTQPTLRLRKGEIWVAERGGQVLLEALGQSAVLTIRSA